MYNATVVQSVKTPVEARVPSFASHAMWWTKWFWYTFLTAYIGFSLSLSFHQCSIIIFILKLLPERQVDEAWEC
jgi:hypothetical protein